MGTLSNGDLTAEPWPAPPARRPPTPAGSWWATPTRPRSTVSWWPRPTAPAWTRPCTCMQSTGPYAGSYRSLRQRRGQQPAAARGPGLLRAREHRPDQRHAHLPQQPAPDRLRHASSAFQRTAADTRPLVQLTLRGATGAADAFYAYAEAGATPAFDAEFDAVKLPNSTGLNLAASASSAEALAIDGRAAFTASHRAAADRGRARRRQPTRSRPRRSTTCPPASTPTCATRHRPDREPAPAASYAFSVANGPGPGCTGRFTLQFARAARWPPPRRPWPRQVSVYPNPARAFATRGGARPWPGPRPVQASCSTPWARWCAAAAALPASRHQPDAAHGRAGLGRVRRAPDGLGQHYAHQAPDCRITILNAAA